MCVSERERERDLYSRLFGGELFSGTSGLDLVCSADCLDRPLTESDGGGRQRDEQASELRELYLFANNDRGRRRLILCL